MEGLIEGRIVHYNLGNRGNRAAVIVMVLDQSSGMSELNVFWSKTDPEYGKDVLVMSSFKRNEMYHWNWIER